MRDRHLVARPAETVPDTQVPRPRRFLAVPVVILPQDRGPAAERPRTARVVPAAMAGIGEYRIRTALPHRPDPGAQVAAVAVAAPAIRPRAEAAATELPELCSFIGSPCQEISGTGRQWISPDPLLPQNTARAHAENSASPPDASPPVAVT